MRTEETFVPQVVRDLLDERMRPYVFQVALTHKSYADEAKRAGRLDVQDNERYEFLGDAVLQLVMTEWVLESLPGVTEGEAAQRRIQLVNTDALYEVAQSIDLGKHLSLGKGEEKSDGRQKASVLADAVEAVIGAIYDRSGLAAAEGLIKWLWRDRFNAVLAKPLFQDYKTELQQWAVTNGYENPKYVHGQSGPKHDRRYHSKVWLPRKGEQNFFAGSGNGTSKKLADMAAAKKALDALRK